MDPASLEPTDRGELIVPQREGAVEADATSMRRGIAASVALHVGAVLLILLGLRSSKPPRIESVIPVNLVQLGERTLSPASSTIAPLPQEQAHEVATSQTAEAIPTPQLPPPSPAPTKSSAERTATIQSAQRNASHTSKPATRQQQMSPADALAARLKMLAQLRQPPPSMPSHPRQQDGRGESSVTATNALGHGSDATYAVKDFIRAQVERRWNLNESAATAHNWTVSIRIALDHNGRVLTAEIVDDPRFRDDDAYRDFAHSARNAVLLSSPLLLPDGAYDLAKDIVVDFDPRQVSR